MSRERAKEEEKRRGAAPKRTPQLYKPYGGRLNARRGKTRYLESEKLPETRRWRASAKLTVLESNSCLFCAKTFSTPACSAYVTKPNPLEKKGKKRNPGRRN